MGSVTFLSRFAHHVSWIQSIETDTSIMDRQLNFSTAHTPKTIIVIINTEMSYNGIGLQTARGSGTSGYVQTSLVLSDGVIPGNYKKRKIMSKRKEEEAILKVDEANKYKARLEIEKHGKKRQIEVKCMELREELEDVEKENVIEQRIAELRCKLIKDMNSNKDDDIQKHSSEIEKSYKDDAVLLKTSNGKEESLGAIHINVKESTDVAVNHLDTDRALKYVPRYKSRETDIRRLPRL